LSSFTKNYYGDQVKEESWAGHVARMAEKTNLYKNLVGIFDVKAAFGRREHKWEVNIRVDIK
jgi:hypothetical protein